MPDVTVNVVRFVSGIEETGEFDCADGNKYDIHKGVINFTNFPFYKFHCSSCSKQDDIIMSSFYSLG